MFELALFSASNLTTSQLKKPVLGKQNALDTRLLYEVSIPSKQIIVARVLNDLCDLCTREAALIRNLKPNSDTKLLQLHYEIFES